MYIGGMSSSLPEDVQYEMYRTVPGLENVKIVRNAYAIEYDCIDARQLRPSLEFKNISSSIAEGSLMGVPDMKKRRPRADRWHKCSQEAAGKREHNIGPISGLYWSVD